MKKILSLLLLFAALSIQAQTGSDNRTYSLKELSQKPVLANGNSFEDYFAKNFHPAKPVGATAISFLIEKVGVAHHITLFDSEDAQAKAEAERVLQAAGKWKPGVKEGKTVRVRYRFTYGAKAGK